MPQDVNVTGLADQAVALAMTYAPRLVLAIVTLIVGMWLINRFVGLIGMGMQRRQVDQTLASFIRSVANLGLKALLIISVASMVGIETTSFIAVLGAAGLAIGLSLQGSLGNLAGGVMVLLFRPFRVGDFIEAQGVSGTVSAIQIFNTVIRTGDNKTIIVPNGAISSGIITNYSLQETRRVDMTFGIGYDDDIKKARDVLTGLIAQDERILDDPAPLVVIGSLGDSSVNFTVRTWVKSADYWGVFFDMQEKVKLAFDEAGISIPYPQQDVHLHQADGS